MALLALLRHGPTDWTAERRLQGRTDLPLSAAGRASVGAWQLPREIEGFAWVTSPLARARETARLLGHGEADVDARLAEMSFGEWEGQRLADVSRALGPAMSQLEDRGIEFRAPGGESPREVQQRLAPFLAEIGANGVDRLAVTHKAVIRALYAQASGWAMIGRPPQRLAEFALHLFAVADDGMLTIRRLNLPLAPERSGDRIFGSRP
jgi:broad specificity phosphatase PhoE